MNHRIKHHYRILLTLILLATGFLALAPAVDAAGCLSLPRLDLSPCKSIRGASTASSEPFTVPEIPADSFLPEATYGWVEDYAYFFDRPGPGATPARTARSGVFYGQAVETVTDENGKVWHKVWGDWLPERYYHQVEASQFMGIEANRQPERPFGWVLRATTPSPAPAADPLPGTQELARYDFVQMVQWQRGADGNTWYEVGPGQWMRYDTVALTTVRDRPAAVGAQEYWVDVDLLQQTFAAYEGDRLVYAGLISSGLPRWQTRTGLNQVWERREVSLMEGGVQGDDYYYIDDVAHTLYFDDETALHGAFWHDDFGRPKSHGCVNMAPYTAEWVFNWSKRAPNDLWVRVHYADYEDILR